MLKVLLNWNLVWLWPLKLYVQQAIVYLANEEYEQECKQLVNVSKYYCVQIQCNYVIVCLKGIGIGFVLIVFLY